MALEIYYGLAYSYGIEVKHRYDSKDFRRDVISRMAKQNKEFQDLSQLKPFRDAIWNAFQFLKANQNFSRRGKAPVQFMTKTQILKNLKTNKNASIMYDGGVFVITPKSSYGGFICGFTSDEIVKDLLQSNQISQDVYFNADGRKSYSLYRKDKQTALPASLRGLGLSGSYLAACGIR